MLSEVLQSGDRYREVAQDGLDRYDLWRANLPASGRVLAAAAAAAALEVGEDGEGDGSGDF